MKKLNRKIKISFSTRWCTVLNIYVYNLYLLLYKPWKLNSIRALNNSFYRDFYMVIIFWNDDTRWMQKKMWLCFLNEGKTLHIWVYQNIDIIKYLKSNIYFLLKMIKIKFMSKNPGKSTFWSYLINVHNISPVWY